MADDELPPAEEEHQPFTYRRPAGDDIPYAELDYGDQLQEAAKGLNHVSHSLPGLHEDFTVNRKTQELIIPLHLHIKDGTDLRTLEGKRFHRLPHMPLTASSKAQVEKLICTLAEYGIVRPKAVTHEYMPSVLMLGLENEGHAMHPEQESYCEFLAELRIPAASVDFVRVSALIELGKKRNEHSHNAYILRDHNAEAIVDAVIYHNFNNPAKLARFADDILQSVDPVPATGTTPYRSVRSAYRFLKGEPEKPVENPLPADTELDEAALRTAAELFKDAKISTIYPQRFHVMREGSKLLLAITIPTRTTKDVNKRGFDGSIPLEEIGLRPDKMTHVGQFLGELEEAGVIKPGMRERVTCTVQKRETGMTAVSSFENKGGEHVTATVNIPADMLNLHAIAPYVEQTKRDRARQNVLDTMNSYKVTDEQAMTHARVKCNGDMARLGGLVKRLAQAHPEVDARLERIRQSFVAKTSAEVNSPGYKARG